MQEIRGNLFQPRTYTEADGGPLGRHISWHPDAICITTNGFVKKNGEAVMGRGCAKEAARLMPGLPEILGNHLRNNAAGNRVYSYGPWNRMSIVTFPVKDTHEYCKSDKSNVVKHMRNKFRSGDLVPGWACVARTDIIRESARQLAKLANELYWSHVILPRPGCGAGELNWSNIKPLIEPILDDKFYSITF